MSEDVERFTALSREYDRWGKTVQHGESIADVLGRTSKDELQLGTMLRCAAALEEIQNLLCAAGLKEIRDVLSLALEPLLAEASAQRSTRRREIRAEWETWISQQEKRHGPCPEHVSSHLWKQFYHHSGTEQRWQLWGCCYNRSGVLDNKPSWPFEPRPPCGKRSKAHQDYKAWRKRRIRAQRKGVASAEAKC